VVFDLDNTLIESKIDYARLRSEAFAALQHGGVGADAIDPVASTSANILQARRRMLQENGTTAARELDRLVGQSLARMELEHVEESRPVPGAERAIRTLKKEGYALSVLTRGSRGYALRALTVSGLDGLIDQLVCRDDYPLDEAKPNSVALQRAAAAINLAPRECVLVGDHVIDLECAISAGARFVGVLTGSTTRVQWERAGCELIIGSVADLPELLRRESGA
jgi:phosphoglycolate phosphatase